MKSLYIIPFLLLSATFYAQEKKSAELQDQERVLKDAKAFEKKMQSQNELKANKKDNVLASDQASEVKQQAQTAQKETNQGKLIANTASIEEVFATIPNRQNAKKTGASANHAVKIQGIPSTSTLEEIKKTIPKN